MVQSGKFGATPMVSRPGKQTIAEYTCFNNGNKEKNLPSANLFDLSKMQVNEIKERLKMEMNMHDKHSSRAQAILQEIQEIDDDKLILASKEQTRVGSPSMLSKGTRKLATKPNSQADLEIDRASVEFKGSVQGSEDGEEDDLDENGQ